MLERLPKDPLLAFVVDGDNGAAILDAILARVRQFVPDEQAGRIDEGLAKVDEELGFSLRDDLLAHLGPEVAFVLDVPPIDSAFGAVISEAPDSVSTVLGKIGLWIDVSEAESVDRALRAMFTKAEFTVAEDEDLVHLSITPGAAGPKVHVYYRLAGGMLAMGFDPARVRAMTGEVEAADSIKAGEDFKEVFAQLDRDATTVVYVNLPRLQSLLTESEFVQGALQENEEAESVAALIADPEVATTGWGMSTVAVGKGARRVSYGPAWMSSGAGVLGMVAAVAVPNLFKELEGRGFNQTVGDIRTIGTCFEAYAVDNNRYPGPTDGWVDVEAVAEELEPMYVAEMPRVDGWGNPYRVWSDGTSYRIVSSGEDGVTTRDWLGDLSEVEQQALAEGDDDIVFGDAYLYVLEE
jgi:type II secretory pathway pseudopilin PulG